MLFELESLNNFSEERWISFKFGEVYGEHVLIWPCKNELNLMNEKKFGTYLVKCFQLKKWTFGSLITSAYHHGFHPNLVRVTPTVCTSYPVKMVKIWWGQKIHHFSLKSTLSVCQSLWVHKQQHSWIPTKLGTKHPWCVLIHSCEYELILRPKNFHFFFVLSVIFQLKVNFLVTYNYYECSWIPTKFKPSHSHYVL